MHDLFELRMNVMVKRENGENRDEETQEKVRNKLTEKTHGSGFEVAQHCFGSKLQFSACLPMVNYHPPLS